MKINRLTYNSELHSNHKKEWTTKDLIYLCGVYEIDKKRIFLLLWKEQKMLYSKKLIF